MLQAFLNSLKIKEVREKLIWTFGLLAVYRLGSHIVLPGVDPTQLGGSQSGWMQLADMFSGGAFSQFAIFALGIMPYISASIMMQLLTAVIPRLEELKKEGQQGQKTINQYTRYLTVGISAIQGLGMAINAEQTGVVLTSGWHFRIFATLTLTAGAVFLMWLGEQISENGIGNGISLLIFVAIVSQVSASFIGFLRTWRIGEFGPIAMVTLPALLIGLFVLCVWIQTGERRVPVKYAKQVRGRKVYGGRESHLPLKVNYSGVIAVIFASSVMLFPALIFSFAFGATDPGGWVGWTLSFFERGAPLWALIYTGLIVFFCYFYTAITFNPDDVAENLKESGGFIPGRRPGKNTAELINKILTRITLVGSVVVALIAIVPIWMQRWWFPSVPLYFGGTSILIIVGVGLDFVNKLESQLLMRHYEGFMETGRVQGRGFGGG